MRNTIKKAICLIGAVLFFLPAVLSAEPPPAEVNEVLGEMSKFDESYTAGKFDDASVAVQNMEKLINDIFVQAKLDDFVLEEALADLKKNVAAKNVEGVEAAYLAFQKQFFNFVSHFDNDVHPILARIEYYVMKGAPDAYAGKDYERVLRDMETATVLMDHGRAVLTNKGISSQEINQFTAKVSALNLAVKKGDTATIDSLLEQLQGEYGSFMSRYSKK